MNINLNTAKRRPVSHAVQSWGAFTNRITGGGVRVITLYGKPTAAAVPAAWVRDRMRVHPQHQRTITTTGSRTMHKEFSRIVRAARDDHAEPIHIAHTATRETIAIVPLDWLARTLDIPTKTLEELPMERPRRHRTPRQKGGAAA